MVDNNGKIVAKRKGSAEITAKTSNGKEAKCTVKVNKSFSVVIEDEEGFGYSKVVKFGARKFLIYDQHSQVFKMNAFISMDSMSYCGSGLCAEATVLSGAGRNISPLDIANDLGLKYERSINHVAGDLTGYGINSRARIGQNKTNTKEEIDNNLKEGKPVIILVRRAEDDTFISPTHYLTLIGYKDGKPIIADSDGGRVTTISLETIVDKYMYTGANQEEGYVLVD